MSNRMPARAAASPLPPFGRARPLRLPLAAVPWLFAAGDAAVILAAAALAEAAYHGLAGGSADMQRSLGLGAAAAILFAALQRGSGVYRGARHIRLARQARGALASWLIAFAVLGGLLFLLKLGDAFSRAMVVAFFAAGLAGLFAWRFAMRRLSRRLATAGSLAGPRVALLVGQGGPDVAGQLARLRRGGYAVTRLFMLPDRDGDDANDALVSTLAGLVRHVREQEVDEILVLASWRGVAASPAIEDALRMVPVPAKLVADPGLSRLLAHAPCEVAGGRGLLLKPAPLGAAQRLAKRAFDVAVAGALLALLAPALALAALAIRLETPGPALFRQWRGGFNGRRFRICKLRTMRVAEDGPAVAQARRGDPRVTRVGRWLRATSVDELPQLWNVLKGDMSLVGPRPHAIVHDRTYAALIEPYPARHNVKPGITGWAQVQGCRGETADAGQMRRRVGHDLAYVENWSFGLDLLILALTVREVLRPRNAY